MIYHHDHHDHDHPLSGQDIMTDLNAESELLPLQPVREEWKGHKVIVDDMWRLWLVN